VECVLRPCMMGELVLRGAVCALGRHRGGDDGFAAPDRGHEGGAVQAQHDMSAKRYKLFCGISWVASLISLCQCSTRNQRQLRLSLNVDECNNIPVYHC